MEGINVIEILKLGLPGLVFLLCVLSYKLLSKAQDAENQNQNKDIVPAIKTYMFFSFVFAVLTIAAPIAESMLISQTKILENIEAKASPNGRVDVGKAAVCSNKEYSGRYLLVMNKNTQNMIQVRADMVLPLSCENAEQITLSQIDLEKLGWSNNKLKNRNLVHISVAAEGQKFIMNAVPQIVALTGDSI